MYTAQKNVNGNHWGIHNNGAAVAAVVANKETVWQILEALNFHQALAPSDELFRAVCSLATENDDLRDRLAEADAKVECLKSLIMELDETLEEALHQLRIEYAK